MNWVILVVAGIFEIGWAIGLKYTEGFTRFWPTVGTVLAMVVSLGLLGVAMKGLPVGTAYSVWVGVGAVGTVILGILLLGEPASVARIVSVVLILAGIVGLKVTVAAEDDCHRRCKALGTQAIDGRPRRSPLLTRGSSSRHTRCRRSNQRMVLLFEESVRPISTAITQS